MHQKHCAEGEMPPKSRASVNVPYCLCVEIEEAQGRITMQWPMAWQVGQGPGMSKAERLESIKRRTIWIDLWD